MKAIKTTAGHRAEIQDVSIPALRDDYILVKVKAVALNPTDWKHIDIVSPPGTTIGCDLAGVVEEVGAKVDRDWKQGDRIAGFVHGGNEVQPEDGCFAELCVAKAALGMKIPGHLTDEEACTLGVGVTTVGQGLYQSLGLPLPDGSGSITETNLSLLVYGGSTATGSLAIQYARLSGCTQVLTTCSEKNFAFVKSLGAHTAFDYKDPECARKIREYTNDSLGYAFDCISTSESAGICSEAIGSEGGVVSYLLPVKHERDDVQVKYTLAYTATGEYFSFAGGSRKFEARQQDLEFGKKFWELSARLFVDGRIRVHPPQVRNGGLEGVFEGLQMMREGRVSGSKLVYRVEETG